MTDPKGWPIQIQPISFCFASDKYKIVHLKGFSKGLTKQRSDAELKLLAYLEQFDVICFDGDELRPDSYTRVLPKLLECNKNKPFNIVAFIWSHDKTKFLSKWNASELNNTPNCYYCCLDSSLIKNHKHDEKYAALGVEALKVSKATDICSFGGGAVVSQEFALTSNTHHWHYFPITRLSKNRNTGKTVEERSSLDSILTSNLFSIHK